ncbi:MAG: hypothetical protein B7Z60_07895 [Ferrovum sp. 37-45-19]|jgi:HAD superfamily hydrolase (TIGR01459 family)|nr:MAG: hypothetical protein B7Z65_07650 [Ferrovum sp. 21-44-67]OYV93698.1 MAG: hypothetical protein B7Z60_07895 [Ferrovum sp. 37-45-19]OZB31675.1 MAG: hypothetical protein B7X47_09160 [Ferrovum sp. 34-44-207]HQT82189.1 TIGR01459 family HAD-type hydrolase [Ferrovaceae bacterium]
MKPQPMNYPNESPQSIHSLLAIADRYQVFLFDQWGVLHNGQYLYPHVNKTLRHLAELNKHIIILSNSGKSAAVNCDRLLDMGLDRDLAHHIITSGDVARWAFECAHTKINQFIHKKILWLDSTLDTLAGLDKDLSLLTYYQAVVLAGLTDELPHEFYEQLMRDIYHHHLPLLCINPDIHRFTPQGIKPSVGFYGQYVKDLGGKVEFIGKPDALVYQYTLNHYLITDSRQVLMVGDSIHHDILGASTMNMDSVLMRSGIHKSLFKDSNSDIEVVSHWQREGLPIPTYMMDQVQ